jgi:hypothetical protein
MDFKKFLAKQVISEKDDSFDDSSDLPLDIDSKKIKKGVERDEIKETPNKDKDDGEVTDKKDDVTPKTKDPFSKRLENLGDDWKYKMEYNAQAHPHSKWSVELKSVKNERKFSADAGTYVDALHLLILQCKTKGIDI